MTASSCSSSLSTSRRRRRSRPPTWLHRRLPPPLSAAAARPTTAATPAPTTTTTANITSLLRLRLPSFLLVALLVLTLSASVPTAGAYQGALSDDSLRRIPSGGGDFDIRDGPLLAPILVPRVPGTPGSAAAQRHFVDFFRTHLPLWRVEWHNITSRTPATGDREVPFSNLIFTRDPPWAEARAREATGEADGGDVGRLVLAAHYDTLYRPEGFIGAVDSAAPCAILLHVARSLDDALTRKWASMEADGSAGDGLDEDRGVQIVLLDGEEAWETWSATDSLYGARALADAWDRRAYPPGAAHRSPLRAVSLFVLLDLLGAPDPRIPSYFRDTHWAYEAMARVEARLRALGLLHHAAAAAAHPKKGAEAAANAAATDAVFLHEAGPHQFRRGYIEDDHIPFMERGVPILHVIPTPFPATWHTMDDDGEHLHVDTIDDWGKIVTGFTAEWLELEGFMIAPKQALTQKKEGDDGGESIRDRSEL